MNEEQNIPNEKSEKLKNEKNERLSAEQSETRNEQPETRGMETHAHHLHKAPGQGWRHYLFEFLMLFLAVTLGFFVENLREHSVEKKREKQFIRSMLADLKEDSLKLSYTMKEERERIRGMATLLQGILDYSGQGDARNLYRLFGMWGEYFPGLQLTDRTIAQLKYSGSMRLIHKQHVSDSILYYDETSRIIRVMQDENIMYFVRKTFDQLMKIINSSYYVRAGNLDSLMLMNESLGLLTNERSELMASYNNISFLRRMIITRQHLLEEHLDRARRLIILLKKEYHLK